MNFKYTARYKWSQTPKVVSLNKVWLRCIPFLQFHAKSKFQFNWSERKSNWDFSSICIIALHFITDICRISCWTIYLIKLMSFLSNAFTTYIFLSATPMKQIEHWTESDRETDRERKKHCPTRELKTISEKRGIDFMTWGDLYVPTLRVTQPEWVFISTSACRHTELCPTQPYCKSHHPTFLL